jgi:selenocysteine lyase/cysteine desulfurase
LGWSSTDEFTSLETMESTPLPDHAKRFQYGTLSYEGIYALGAAFDYIDSVGIEAIEKHNLELIRLLREKLTDTGVQFHTPVNTRSPILSFFTENEKALGIELRNKGIHVTARRWREGHIRISPHFYNNEDDIEAFVEAYSGIKI